MEINFNENSDKWDDFIALSPQRNIFVHSDFLNSLDLKYDLVTCYENGQIIAGTPILYEKEKPIQSNFPFTQYQGICLSDNTTMENHSKIPLEFAILENFIGELVNHYKKFHNSLSWRFPDLRPFQWHNYHESYNGVFNVNLRYTPVLDITKYKNIDEYLDSIRRLRRREIAKAEKTLIIEETSDTAILDELHDKTFNRQGIERDEEESVLLKNITKYALEGNYGRLVCARLEGKPVSALLSLFDDRTCFHLFAGNDPDYRDSGAGTFLIVDSIKDAMAKGLQEIDFVGANSPFRSAYKLSFNPELKTFFEASFHGKTINKIKI